MSLKLTNFDIILAIIAMNILTYLIIGKSTEIGFTMGNSTFWNIVVSMFCHKDAYHLLGNMITFLFSSVYVYNKETGFIRSRKVFLSTYLVSGLVGSYFQIFIYNMLNFQWETEVSDVADKYNIGPLKTGSVVSLFYRLINYHKIDALKQIYYANHYGAESCIYGIIGVGIWYSLITFKQENMEFRRCLSHSLEDKDYKMTVFFLVKYCYDIFSFFTVIFDIFSKFMDTPWNIRWLLSTTLSDKMINHNSHLGGAIMGVVIGMVISRAQHKQEVNDDKIV
jgi:membrane associated rhomboid family serine protease